MAYLTHFQFLTLLARDLRGLAGIKVYFSFVYVSNTLGSSSEHNCEVCQTIKNEINETVKEVKSETKTYLGGKKGGKDNIGIQIPGSKSWTHKCKGQWR